jgi:hypothetical protein
LIHGSWLRHTHAPSDDHGEFCYARAEEAPGLVAVVATLSKGYDFDYIWKQVDRGPAKDAARFPFPLVARQPVRCYVSACRYVG